MKVIDIIQLKFQSTLPTRGSDAIDAETTQQSINVSIHAPHEGERRM